MSEEKLYAVKNDKGEWLSFDSSHESVWYTNNPTFFKDRIYAEAQSIGSKAHVVELVEAPAKVVLTKEQAEIVEWAHDFDFPASHISNNYCEYEELLMKAYVNGYTVEKEKKYNVKVPLVQAQGGLWFYINSEDKLDASYLQELAKKFTMEEIEENGLQDCEKEECD
jgi:hypothetical protein